MINRLQDYNTGDTEQDIYHEAEGTNSCIPGGSQGTDMGYLSISLWFDGYIDVQRGGGTLL